MTAVNKEESVALKKAPLTGRSPAYPFIALEKAIIRAKEFHSAEGKHAVPPSSACRAWSYGEKSSGGRQTVAALRYFGLMDYKGADVVLTKLALDILLDQIPNSPERAACIKQAAMMPKIHKDLWDKYQAELPSDPTILTYLVRDRGFNQTAAEDLLSEYKDTLTYANFGKSDTVLDIESDSKTNEENGRDNMNTSEQNQSLRHDNNVQLKVGAGERSFLSGPLSKDGAAYRLLVSGTIGPKELGKLIRMLELQKEILEDGDEDVDAP